MEANFLNKDTTVILTANQSDREIMEDVVPKTMLEAIHKTNNLCCFVDASWISTERRAGIGWILINTDGKQILKGSSSIESTGNAVDIEAIALREAIVQIKRWRFQIVIFCGDAREIYGKMNHQ